MKLLKEERLWEKPGSAFVINFSIIIIIIIIIIVIIIIVVIIIIISLFEFK